MIIYFPNKRLHTIFESGLLYTQGQNGEKPPDDEVKETNTSEKQEPQPTVSSFTIPQRHRVKLTTKIDDPDTTSTLRIPENVILKIEYSKKFKINTDKEVTLDFFLCEIPSDPSTALWVLNAHSKLDADTISKNRDNLITQLAEFVNSWDIVLHKEKANPNVNDTTDPRLRVLVTNSPSSLEDGIYTAARLYPTSETTKPPSVTNKPDKLAKFIRDILCPMHRSLDEVRIFGTIIWEIIHSVYEEHSIPFEQRLTLRELAGEIIPQANNDFSKQRIEDKRKLLKIIAAETGYADNSGNPLYLRYFKEAIDEFARIHYLGWANRDNYWRDNDKNGSGNIMSDKVSPKEHLMKEDGQKTRAFNGAEFLQFAQGTTNFLHEVCCEHFGYRKPGSKEQKGEFVPIEPRANYSEIMADHEFEYNALITDTQELGYELKQPRLLSLGKKFADGYSILHELLYSDFGLTFYDPESMDPIKLFLYQARKKLGLRTRIYLAPQAIDINKVKSPYFQKSEFSF